MSCESKKKCYFCTRNEQQVLKNSEITSLVTEKEVFKKNFKKSCKKIWKWENKDVIFAPRKREVLKK